MSYAAPYPNCSTQYSKSLPQVTTTSHSHPSLSCRETCHSERSEAESRNLATWQPLSSPVGAVREPPVPTRHRVAPRPSPPPPPLSSRMRGPIPPPLSSRPTCPMAPSVEDAPLLNTHVLTVIPSPVIPTEAGTHPQTTHPICAIPNPLI